MASRLPAEILRLDPHGAAMLDFLDGCYDESFCYVRDDGFASPMDITRRFADYPAFSPTEKAGCELASGRVLDIGCGSGKHLTYLRAKEMTCAGVDNSPVVMTVLRRRRIEGVFRMDAFRLGIGRAAFNTVTLFSNGLSIGGSVTGIQHLLAEFHRVTTLAGRIIVTNVDVRQSPREHDHRYHRANLAIGRLPGQLTLRCRYRGVYGPAFPWLLLSPDELGGVATGSGWQVMDVRSQPDGTYCALLGKVG